MKEQKTDAHDTAIVKFCFSQEMVAYLREDEAVTADGTMPPTQGSP